MSVLSAQPVARAARAGELMPAVWLAQIPELLPRLMSSPVPQRPLPDPQEVPERALPVLPEETLLSAERAERAVSAGLAALLSPADY